MNQPLTESDAARIARRYPKRSTPRWLKFTVVAAFGAVLVTWSVWAGWKFANPDVAGQIAGYRVVSDTQIDAQVTVQRSDVNSRVQCQVKALAISYDTVGELPFTWEPTGEELQTGWVTIRTFKRAVTADLEWCRVS